MTRKEQIKRLKEYRWHILFLIKEQENMQKENIETEKKKNKNKKLLYLLKTSMVESLKLNNNKYHDIKIN